jgi:hypothetical protein
VAGNGANRAREGPGPPCPYSPPSDPGALSVPAASDGAGEARWCGATLYSIATAAAVFGQPSTYSLSRAELVAHVRALRRAGWQSWEIHARFDLGSAA